ncbi:MAG: heat-inducible transcription repressor HrcA [Deltaproteobacteria bacterium]|nr:heat-inducible transcription repressor HrcA [Deltaproteobacteria bacterium]
MKGLRDILNERERSVLELIVENYIVFAEPVGSSTIARIMKKKVSSATIRSIMGELEELGFLFKPHAVAGRVPTPKAFRHYVNSLPVPGLPGKKELKALEAMLRIRYAYTEEVMADVSRTLAAIASFPSIVVEPRVDTMLFKEVEFVRMSRYTILIVFVTTSGMVHKRFVDTNEDIEQATLDDMKHYMNERFSGLPFHVIKESIIRDIHRDREHFQDLYRKIQDTLDMLVGDEDKREVYIEGASKMIGIPEYSDVEKLKELFKALENKERLIQLLDEYQSKEGIINVILGSESDMKGMEGMSIIASAYRIDRDSYGVLGIIGPMRMNYSRLIPIVGYTARTVTDLFKIM